MNNSQQIILMISLLVPTLLGLVSYKLFKIYEQKQFLHQAEFWASLGVNIILSLIFSRIQTSVAALSMLTWPWTLRTFRIVMEDFSGRKIIIPGYLIILFAAGFISFVLGGSGVNFFYTTLIFSFTFGMLGLMSVYRSRKDDNRKNLSPIIKISYLLFGLYFFKRLFFPLTRLDKTFAFFDQLMESMILISFAGVILAACFEMLKQNSDEEKLKLLEDRSKKFIGQSKFSELGMLSAGIAHEINNPLALIQARTSQLLRLCKKNGIHKEICDGLQQILSTSERINKTIQGIREFVHQDENSPVIDINIKELFENVLFFCGQRMKNHGVSFRFYGTGSISIVGHKIQLEQLILNLLNNSFDAIEFLPDKWIEVSCEESDDKVQIYFKDSGRGIPIDISSKMMDPFFTTKDIGRGTGLGLSLARGIAEQHGGYLKYLSDRPHTTFLLELPKRIHQETVIPFH